MEFLPPGGRAYVLVKQSKLTNEMINRSSSYDLSNIKQVVRKGFIKNTKFCILELDGRMLQNTHTYDKYKWYTKEDLEKEVNDSEKYVQENSKKDDQKKSRQKD